LINNFNFEQKFRFLTTILIVAKTFDFEQKMSFDKKFDFGQNFLFRKNNGFWTEIQTKHIVNF